MSADSAATMPRGALPSHPFNCSSSLVLVHTKGVHMCANVSSDMVSFSWDRKRKPFQTYV